MTDKLKLTTGQRLKTLRKARGITQEALAEMIKRTPETVSNIERGKYSPNLDTLERISVALEISLSSVFEEDERKTVRLLRSYAIEERFYTAIKSLSDKDLETALLIIEMLAQRQQKG